MNAYQIKRLAFQAVNDGVIEIECPVCGNVITTEPDAQDIYCGDCGKVTGKNPLVELGLI